MVSRAGGHRLNHTAAATAAAVPTTVVSDADFWRAHAPRPTKQELLALVDPAEDDFSLDEHLDFFRDPFRSGYAPADDNEVLVSEKQHDVEYPLAHDLSEGDDRQRRTLWDLRRAVLLRLRNPVKFSANDIYEIYRQLPERPMSYISGKLRHQMLHALGMIERKDAKSMLRYFAVIADVKDAGLALRRAEWNAAISFAARYVGSSTDSEAEAALGLWREMEQQAGIKGNDVTFNILFDVASKAGNFTLAEMIYHEMQKRGHAYNRYHHVSLIHFFGLKQDADGVRAAYRNMVEAGELVDVVALNCVIAGLLRSGEETAAHQVYRRMTTRHNKAARLPKRDYNANKMITKVMMMFAKLGKDHPEMRPSFQASSSTTPDISTYRILINHSAIKLGDLHAVAQFLDEMKFFEVPLHGAIFLALFKGFAIHGGGMNSRWSEQRLQSVWDALVEALDSQASGLYVDTWLAIWALRAFNKCSTPEMVFKAYNTLSLRWDLDEAKTDQMIKELHRLLQHKSQQVEILRSLGKRNYG